MSEQSINSPAGHASQETDSVLQGNESADVPMGHVMYRGKLFLADPVIRNDRLKHCDGYYTQNNDNFKDVCRELGLDRAQWRIYYEYVHRHT